MPPLPSSDTISYGPSKAPALRDMLSACSAGLKESRYVLRRERTREQILDRTLPIVFQCTRTGAGEVRMRDDGAVRLPARLPGAAAPGAPAILLLIEHLQWLVAQLRELRAPAGPAADRVVVEDRANHVDFLPAVHLVPQRLQYFPNGGCVGVAPVHKARHVFEADVARLQLLVVQDAYASLPRDLVPFECEVHLVDAAALGLGSELAFGTSGPAAEENTIAWVHRAIIASRCRFHPVRTAPASPS